MSFIALDKDHCLHYNYKMTECHSCRKVCPRQCWNDAGEAVPERCDSCGLCLSVCPVDAIGIEGIPLSAWQELVRSGTGDLHLSCRRHGDGPWACLGFLNARELVALAWGAGEGGSRNVFLHVSACQECRPAVAESLTGAMEAADGFLTLFRSGRILPEAGSPPHTEEALNRRSFFTSLFSAGVQTARNVLWPEDGTAPLPKSQWRAGIFRGRPLPGAEITQEVFPAMSVESSCLACGLCAKLCPTQAITAEEDSRGLVLWHEPLLCTGCGLCAAHCPESSIALLSIGPAQKRKLIAQDFPRCNECGGVFKPAGRQLTCFDCLLKGRQSVFGP